ncbi:type II toxin-antitoxin system YafQ family toxin [Candidatus Peregrinibacteria bacterium]|nr:type II toxin-antitoxin system YafQ family toxin [Candidatus Peregrinibacteria bacterium]MBI3816363.1 type II toxin-antitoxin system YafQ family toxin [Candidatus Peregrinibacteria bacterium]
MYTVIETKRFRHDVKRLGKTGRYDLEKLDRVVDLLSHGEMLSERCDDHPLRGDAEGSRECHIESDWLLVYERDRNVLVLSLLRTGTHSQLFHE